SMGKGLLGPSGGSGGTLEGRFGEHCGGTEWEREKMNQWVEWEVVR
ncbi:hypothetical protein Tco_0696444, partial [Tanacetum coccineum]